MNSICTECGTAGKPKRVTRGSILIEIILWLCFLIPGLIYSVWRLTTRHDACGACGSRNMVPLSSPRGKKLAADFGLEVGDAERSGAEAFGRRVGKAFAKN